ncbi:MAG TPA: class I SAM-dependent methyltransferase [Polyangiaceae bacterium]
MSQEQSSPPAASVSPWRRWDVLVSLMQERGLTKFVEIGCKEGRTTSHVLRALPLARAVAIDTWRAMPHQSGVECGETYDRWDFNEIEREFRQNISGLEGRCLMIRATSEFVAARFAQLCSPHLGATFADVVFIDASHDYTNVKADILNWSANLGHNGILAGHDFNESWPTVRRAVLEVLDPSSVRFGPDAVWYVEYDSMVRSLVG